MDKRSEIIKEFVTRVWNYSIEVFNTFDEKDYTMIENTFRFQVWNLKRNLKGLIK